jgi:hypothetical protein
MHGDTTHSTQFETKELFGQKYKDAVITNADKITVSKFHIMQLAT